MKKDRHSGKKITITHQFLLKSIHFKHPPLELQVKKTVRSKQPSSITSEVEFLHYAAASPFFGLWCRCLLKPIWFWWVVWKLRCIQPVLFGSCRQKNKKMNDCYYMHRPKISQWKGFDHISHLFPHPCTPCISPAWTLIQAASNRDPSCRYLPVHQWLTNAGWPWPYVLIVTVIVCWPVCCPYNKSQQECQSLQWMIMQVIRTIEKKKKKKVPQTHKLSNART